jgi:hypothetical protein
MSYLDIGGVDSLGRIAKPVQSDLRVKETKWTHYCPKSIFK